MTTGVGKSTLINSIFREKLAEHIALEAPNQKPRVLENLQSKIPGF